MPPNRRKEQRNSFYFFMQHLRSDYSSRGEHVGGMAEIAVIAGPKWASMSTAERKPFEDMAKQAKAQRQNDPNQKFTSQGIPYAQIEREETERREKEESMLHEIEQTVRTLDIPEGLKRHPFYLVHVNYYCMREGVYYPCEIAISRLVLSRGVDDSMSTIIQLRNIPPGYAYEAKKISEETHEIPPPECNSTQDYAEEYATLFAKIHSFLMIGRGEDTLPPLYTMPNNIEPVVTGLKFLQKEVEVRFPDSIQSQMKFRVYPLPILFYELRNACARCTAGVGFPVLSLAERELEKDIFNFTVGIACEFHEVKESMQHCSLSYVKRWCFQISDFCCQDLGVALIPGSHLPVHSIKVQMQRTPAFESKSVSESEASEKAVYPKNQSSKNTRPFTVHTASEVPVLASRPEPPRLRQPKTMPLAIAGVLNKNQGEASFSSEDFPALGGQGGIYGKLPLAVAGRGRGVTRQETTAARKIGRGRGLAATFSTMSID